MCRESGKPHPGHDCFIFRRDLYSKFQLDDIFIGEPGVGRVLLCNLVRYGTSVRVFTNEAMTFHLGSEGRWKQRSDGAGRLNLENSFKIVRRLYEETEDESRRSALRPHLEALERSQQRRLAM